MVLFSEIWAPDIWPMIDYNGAVPVLYTVIILGE